MGRLYAPSEPIEFARFALGVQETEPHSVSPCVHVVELLRADPERPAEHELAILRREALVANGLLQLKPYLLDLFFPRRLGRSSWLRPPRRGACSLPVEDRRSSPGSREHCSPLSRCHRSSRARKLRPPFRSSETEP